MNTLENSIRIIGGEWRSRRLPVIEQAHCRPTPNRIRETLFNWLSPYIIGARCLDCFAGSGGLSFEALSRGASYACMIEKAPAVCKQLQQNIALFECTPRSRILCSAVQDIGVASMENEEPFSIIFLDPPFGQNLLPPTFNWLLDRNLMTENALIYIESESLILENALPENWDIIKAKKSGQVAYQLIQVKSAPSSNSNEG